MISIINNQDKLRVLSENKTEDFNNVDGITIYSTNNNVEIFLFNLSKTTVNFHANENYNFNVWVFNSNNIKVNCYEDQDVYIPVSNSYNITAYLYGNSDIYALKSSEFKTFLFKDNHLRVLTW